jgi:hypothetical protein
MRADAWVRVPIGTGDPRFLTVPFTRTVLIIARTSGATDWLLDILPELLADTRIQIVFTVEGEHSSVYHQGARDLLSDIGAAEIPWSQALASTFDLIICPTHSATLDGLIGPLLITPHGPGFGKHDSARPGPKLPVPNLPESLADDPNVPATTVLISHPEQKSLFVGHPDRVSLLVVGDPAYDRLVASRPLRGHFRRELGLRPTQRLAVLSSTWGPTSQLARYPGLALRLASELAVDDYRLAMIIHPNIWFGHSTWQLRLWLRRASDAGVLLVPPRGDAWRPVLVSADVLIADHGSVGFYAAAIGTPVVLAGFTHSDLKSASPHAELGRLAPTLDLDTQLKPQLDALIAEHDPSRYEPVVQRMVARAGESLLIMREAIYRLLRLVPPVEPPRVLAVGPPSISLPDLSSHLVFASAVVANDDSDAAVVNVSRFSASMGGGGGGATRSPRSPSPCRKRDGARPPAGAVGGCDCPSRQPCRSLLGFGEGVGATSPRRIWRCAHRGCHQRRARDCAGL